MARFTASQTSTAGNPLVIALWQQNPNFILDQPHQWTWVMGYTAASKSTAGTVGRPVLTREFTFSGSVSGVQPESLDGYGNSQVFIGTIFPGGVPVPTNPPVANITPPFRATWMTNRNNSIVLRRFTDGVLLYADGGTGNDGWTGSLFWEED